MRLRWRRALKEIAAKVGIGLVYKTSFDKANRTSAASVRGIGLDKALPIFAEIRESSACRCSPTCTRPAQCARVAEAVDVLQIPAFLSRQTDLLIAAAQDRQGRQRQEGSVPGAVGHDRTSSPR